jgi:sporulation protein YlmC with PRC-barrel domain
MMGAGKQVNLGLRLLDDQLIDSDGHRCGRVDDVQLSGAPGERTVIEGLLVGPGAWTEKVREPIASLVAEVVPDHIHHVAWDAVSKIETSVELAATAKELGLETHDGRNIQWLGAPPPRTFRLSNLLRSHLYSASGEKLDRVWEVRAERETDLPGEHVNEEWRLVGLIHGRHGLGARVGSSDETKELPAASFTPWEHVAELAPDRVVLRS